MTNEPTHGTILHAPRTVWGDFPDVYILGDETAVRNHQSYAAAKAQADYEAGLKLVMHFLSSEKLLHLEQMIPADAILAAAHAVEGSSVNIIPVSYAALLHAFLGRDFETKIVQTNIVGHTKASGWKRLATPAQFDGTIEAGRRYFLIDDFIGMGGTLANLKGYVETAGGIVVGASVLTGKDISAKMNLSNEIIEQLNRKYDETFQTWWRSVFGFGFEFLTHSEAGYLLRQTKGADAVRDKILAEMRP